MNLHTTLKAYNEVSPITKEQQLILNEAQSILDNSEQKDLSVLDKLGMNDNLKEYQKITSENEQAAKFEEIYDISVIRKMAINYGLRFLPADMYKGTIDPVLPSVLNRFCEKNNISITLLEKSGDYDWRTGERRSTHSKQFFILAPSTSFKLEPKPKDPIIFYKINKNKYALIHKWGNDLNNGRLLSNFALRSTTHICLTFSVALIISICLAVIITGHKEAFALLSGLMANIMIADCDVNSETWDSKHI